MAKFKTYGIVDINKKEIIKIVKAKTFKQASEKLLYHLNFLVMEIPNAENTNIKKLLEN